MSNSLLALRHRPTEGFDVQPAATPSYLSGYLRRPTTQPARSQAPMVHAPSVTHEVAADSTRPDDSEPRSTWAM